MRKLSPAQQKVIHALKQNPSSYIYRTDSFGQQELRLLGFKLLFVFKIRTLEKLLKLELIKPNGVPGQYNLSENNLTS